MLKKTITFKDLDGNDLSEDFYFHLTKADIIELELSEKGGLTAYLEDIVKTQEAGELIAKFKEIIKMTVGRRSEDGRRFIKNEDILNDFMQTEAYSELFMELATNADAAAAFMNALIPAGMEEQVKKEMEARKATDVELPPNASPVDEPAYGTREYYAVQLKDPNWTPSPRDLQIMDKDQLATAFQRKAQ